MKQKLIVAVLLALFVVCGTATAGGSSNDRGGNQQSKYDNNKDDHKNNKDNHKMVKDDHKNSEDNHNTDKDDHKNNKHDYPKDNHVVTVPEPSTAMLLALGLLGVGLLHIRRSNT